MKKIIVSALTMGSFFLAGAAFAAVPAPMPTANPVPVMEARPIIVPADAATSSTMMDGSTGMPIKDMMDIAVPAEPAQDIQIMRVAPGEQGGIMAGRGRGQMYNNYMMGGLRDYRTSAATTCFHIMAALCFGITMILAWTTMIMIIIALYRWNKQQQQIKVVKID